ncbi:MAG: bifunctional proline dehydrogenase/L-glutamate gamma-semialdehyde dehydrogenase [Gammaproteobacteria bacterium RIFCSPHIGHO2_12_FULL_42_13]|nr:MAG: bifunctional proline dehydrogenase/L-glutamate gamma-semialdehyde dehydrogenase [Gammaproteobacteria bacterium RIFCSPHIGHO2_12_FULL_42_13]
MYIFKHIQHHRPPQRAVISERYYQDETTAIQFLLSQLRDGGLMESAAHNAIGEIATQLVTEVRSHKNDSVSVEALMMEYDLSSEEGVVLMCLAEALLRIPDRDTEDLLIKDKLTSANWKKHLGASASTFVNVTTRSLALSGKILDEGAHKNVFSKIWFGLLSRVGEPVIREAVRRAIKIMGAHFVLGRTMDEALKNAKPFAKEGYLFSFDMLGEMARTFAQANRYFEAYQNAITVLANAPSRDQGFASPSISIKLSALHPRYEFMKRETVVPFLIDRLKTLVFQAKKSGVSVTVDAEESNRLGLSLDIFEAVFADPDFSRWDGLGLAIQAYQKRAYVVLEHLIDLARRHKKRFHVRLVKGAYWDTEIKLAQVGGHPGYPVFTRKASTDVCYLACAQLLLKSMDTVYPQFATHNAYTVAAILWMASKITSAEKLGEKFEFQHLQGMGKALHHVLLHSEKYRAPSRIYAPVGQHQDLLPYLVRRLLENGANTSFVHQIANPAIPVEALVESPLHKVASLASIPNEKIPLPSDIYKMNHATHRINSRGVDISYRPDLSELFTQVSPFEKTQWIATPFSRAFIHDEKKAVINPNDEADVVGHVQMGTEEDVASALAYADNAFFDWDFCGVEHRSAMLEKMADALENNRGELFALLIREAGKTLSDAVAEVREAVDFCRYYAETARTLLAESLLPGPTGEANTLRMHGLGTVVCISPWNFPLAIFTGQIAASLVAGNCVIAKPAAQTNLIAARAVALFHQAGIPTAVLQLLPGAGSVVGHALITDERAKGVLLTGSTETAKMIQKTLANRQGAIVPLIAETGGINAMIVDSSALLEQVVGDAMVSAFGSAGQRCSALRILLVQEDIADAFLTMLAGAMETWSVGNTADISVDVGPVIDHAARKMLQTYVDEMRMKAKVIAEMKLSARNHGNYIAPIAFELPSMALLQKEVFGPVLHIVRFRRTELDAVIDRINQLGYGLTLGIHSRIDDTIHHIASRVRVGNIYVNRTMIGAVVGVQPFGGCGLSGTGPKAGGPHYLLRLCRESTLTINTAAMGGDAALLALGPS